MPASPELHPSACPPPLRSAEGGAVAARRKVAGIDANAPLVGFALSGGGIRSATFCLGLFQALARQNLLRRIDLLSTVSGGGYFGSFLGAAFSREGSTPDSVRDELADNHSWSVRWLRENGRFLSPNGSGDNWLTAAVALRNWFALQLVLLTFGFLVFGFAALVRADLSTSIYTRDAWLPVESFFWMHSVAGLWWSPWLLLTAVPFAGLMLPTGLVYWSTQLLPVMAVVRLTLGIFHHPFRGMTSTEFASRAQQLLTRWFMIGLVATVVLFSFALVDSMGQTAYLRWSENGFTFPSLWTLLTAVGAGLFGFGTKLALYAERLLGTRGFRIPFNVVALALALAWLFLVVLALAVTACGFAWQWYLVWDGLLYHPMSGNWKLMVAVAVCFGASWIFSRSFGFVNLSSMQQMYAARLARAYLGATNPERRRHANHSMTELIAGDDLALEDYAPHVRGGPLHFVNVTVNETLSGRTGIERRDRKGFPMALGPCGLSVGINAHALWAAEPARPLRRAPLHAALWENRDRAISPIATSSHSGDVPALFDRAATPAGKPRRIEALALGRWTAISGAAFTTGTGANTSVGLSLLLGLANVRLGYWWDSGIAPARSGDPRPNLLEVASRVVSRILPVQTCLMTEFFARFHGPGRRHWYLSDGGHFENSGCYELVRRRVPFIVCSDAGQDPDYQFADFANLVRKARIDFGAEIQVVRPMDDEATDDPGVRFPLPKLEQLVHPSLRGVIGAPEDFSPPAAPDVTGPKPACCTGRHALLARIHYLDTDEFSWLLLIKPSLMGDEAADVIQYQRTHPLFPQEPTTDQYFDEAQWESYRKLGEHIGAELFNPPPSVEEGTAGWSPSQMVPPTPPVIRPA